MEQFSKRHSPQQLKAALGVKEASFFRSGS